MKQINFKGFSLVEITIVVVIMGIMFGVAIPNYQKSMLTAREDDAISNARMIYEANRLYRVNNGYYVLNVDNPGTATVIEIGCDGLDSGTDCDHNELNAQLNTGILANGLTYSYISSADGSTYDLLVKYDSTDILKDFTVKITAGDLKDTTPNANPCCSAGSCPFLLKPLSCS